MLNRGWKGGLAMQSDNLATGLVRRFCPLCQRAESDDRVLCRECGETLVPQGYCGICEDHWVLPEGTPCPKHDVKLEVFSPDAADGLPSGESHAWVTVAIFHDALKAEAPRIRLEAEGIPTFLEGERMGSRSMYQVATGGVKLQVPQGLAAEARVVLSQSWTPPIADDDLDDAWDDLSPAPGGVRRAVMKGVIVFLLVAPLLMTLLSFCFGP
jgi:hypothetical protein